MNCIEKFLKLTNPLPKEFVRNLKLLRNVEEKSIDLKNKLKISREKYLENLKDKIFKILNQTYCKL